MNEKLTLTQTWDKVFPQNDQVAHKKVTFTNHFGITLAADDGGDKDYIPFDKIDTFLKKYIG